VIIGKNITQIFHRPPLSGGPQQGYCGPAPSVVVTVLFHLVFFLLSLTHPLVARAADGDLPEVVKAINDVTAKEARKEDWEAVGVGQLLNTEDQVKTGQESKAEIDTHPGIIRLYQNSLLTIPELGIGMRNKENAVDVRLTRGAGIFRLSPRKKKKFTVTTNQVIMGVKGTTFSVVLEGKELYEQEVTRAIRSFTAMDISGAVIVERWVDPADGTVYSLMKLDRELVGEHLRHLELSRPSDIYVRKAFSNALFRLETEK